jgi:predicted DsbA family dithiol-disulfide isomerase
VRDIEVFADIVCPFTHVGLHRLVEARAARGDTSTLRVRAWPLEWVNGHPVERDLAALEIEALRSSVAPDLFKGFGVAQWPRSSLPAFGLAAAAYAVDDATGAQVSVAVRTALFEDGLDISDPDVIGAVGHTYGVHPMDPAATRAAVENDWELGKARGAKGSPHFFVGDADWFCPSLDIRHEGDQFSIEPATESMREFYEAVFG